MRTVEKSIRLRHFDLNAQVCTLCQGEGQRHLQRVSKRLALVWPESKLDVMVRAQNSIYLGGVLIHK